MATPLGVFSDAVRETLHAAGRRCPADSGCDCRPSPIVLADGNLLAPDGLDRLRGILFIIPDELRAIIPTARGLHAGRREGGDGVPV